MAAEETNKLVASELTKETICCHLRIDPSMIDGAEWHYIQALHRSAIDYVSIHCHRSYEYIDKHEDLAIAVLVLISDLYDERGMYVDSSHSNRTVETILSHHDQNFIGALEGDDDAVR